MRKLKIDGSKFKSELEFHDFIAKELEFPDYYGKNLDALWDCLSTDVLGPFEIEFVNFEAFNELVGPERSQSFREIFRDLEIERNDFKFTLKD